MMSVDKNKLGNKKAYDRGISDVTDKDGEYHPPDGKGVWSAIDRAVFGPSEKDVAYHEGRTEAKKGNKGNSD